MNLYIPSPEPLLNLAAALLERTAAGQVRWSVAGNHSLTARWPGWIFSMERKSDFPQQEFEVSLRGVGGAPVMSFLHDGELLCQLWQAALDTRCNADLDAALVDATEALKGIPNV